MIHKIVVQPIMRLDVVLLKQWDDDTNITRLLVCATNDIPDLIAALQQYVTPPETRDAQTLPY